jgi:sigma-B regulation protein RsbU (phosphoserine phosphatase)
MKILIAEDDPVSSKILQLTLENGGHDVVAVTSGQAAWEAFDADPTRVVISDWMMPEMDGLELCGKVRGRPKTDYTYFILLTAIHTGRENLRKAMNAGVDDFLTKPLDREGIMMRLRVAERIIEFTYQIRQLKELIPICMYCKKVRDDSNYWQAVESYIARHTGSSFSHGICPECFEQHVRMLPSEKRSTPPGAGL